MANITLRDSEMDGFRRAVEACSKWANAHQAEIGVAEMAFGAGLICWGVQSGQLHIGKDILGSKLADVGGSISATVGASSSLFAQSFLGSIFVGGVPGVAGVTPLAPLLAPAIPAIALAGGAAAIFGAFGYTASGLAAKFIEPDFADYVKDASITAVGLLLLIDGARRVIGDKRLAPVVTEIKEGMITLGKNTGGIIISSWEDLQKIVIELGKSSTGSVTAGAGIAAGAAVGGSLAAGSVTVLSSHGLGAVALSLGLVSAPVWPVIAGGAAGLAVGVAAWKGVKHLKSKRNDDHPPLLLNAPTDSDQ